MSSNQAINHQLQQKEHQTVEEETSSMEDILPVVYSQLKKMAHGLRFRFSDNETMNTTAIVHEAYIKLSTADAKWTNTLHFYALAAKAMRQILYNYLRRNNTEKRGGGQIFKLDITELEEFLDIPESIGDELLKLEEALKKLSSHDERAAKIVECRFFGGMTIEETAKYLQISDATVKRSWITAKAWLTAEIKK